MKNCHGFFHVLIFLNKIYLSMHYMIVLDIMRENIRVVVEMRIARIVIAFFIILSGIIPVFAEGYDILVIPVSVITTSKKCTVANVDIEDLLAKKIVDKMELESIAYSPNTNILKISIKNNSDFKHEALDCFENAKILSNSYGVPRVLLISSKIELINPDQQKKFWNKLDLPVLIQPESNMKLITTVTLYNGKDDEVVWSDTYYKKLNLTGEGINNYNTDSARLTAIYAYYNELIPKIFENMKDSKQTHAIMVRSGSDGILLNKDNPVVIPPKLTFAEKLKMAFQGFGGDKKQKKKKSKSTTRTNIKDTVNLKPTFELEQTPKNLKEEENKGVVNKFKRTFQFKLNIMHFDSIKRFLSESFVRSDDAKTKDNAKNILKDRTKQEKSAEVKSAVKSQTKEKTVKKPEPTKVKKESKPENKIKPVKSEKESKVKSSEKKEGLLSRMKKKLDDMKAGSNEKKEIKKNDKNERIKYSTMVVPTDENTSEATKNLQTKPRNNARNYVPKFDTSVNDI